MHHQYASILIGKHLELLHNKLLTFFLYIVSTINRYTMENFDEKFIFFSRNSVNYIKH